MAEKNICQRNPRAFFALLCLVFAFVGTVLGYMTALCYSYAPKPFCEHHPVKLMWYVCKCGEDAFVNYASQASPFHVSCEMFYVNLLLMTVGLVATFVQVFSCGGHANTCLFALCMHLVSFVLLAVSIGLYFEYTPRILDHLKGAVAEQFWPEYTGVASLLCIFVACVFQIGVLFTFGGVQGFPNRYRRLSYPFNGKEECCCEV